MKKNRCLWCGEGSENFCSTIHKNLYFEFKQAIEIKRKQKKIWTKEEILILYKIKEELVKTISYEKN